MSRDGQDVRWAPRRPRRREFEYVRHGTASLVAALDVLMGSVAARPIERNNSTRPWPSTSSSTTAPATPPRRRGRGSPPIPAGACTTPRRTPAG